MCEIEINTNTLRTGWKNKFATTTSRSYGAALSAHIIFYQHHIPKE